jgi:hypothetical protein
VAGRSSSASPSSVPSAANFMQQNHRVVGNSLFMAHDHKVRRGGETNQRAVSGAISLPHETGHGHGSSVHTSNKAGLEAPRIKPRYVDLSDRGNHAGNVSTKAASDMPRNKPRYVDESDQHHPGGSVTLGVYAAKMLEEDGFSRNMHTANHQETQQHTANALHSAMHITHTQGTSSYTSNAFHRAAHTQGPSSHTATSQTHKNSAIAQEGNCRQKDGSLAPNPKLDISSLYDSIANQVAQRRFEIQNQNNMNQQDVGMRVFGAKSMQTPFGNVHDFSPLSEYANGKYRSRESFPMRQTDASKDRLRRQTDMPQSDVVGWNLSHDPSAKHRHETHTHTEHTHAAVESHAHMDSSTRNGHDRHASEDHQVHESESFSDSHTRTVPDHHRAVNARISTEYNKYVSGPPQNVGSQKSMHMNLITRRPRSGGSGVLGMPGGVNNGLHAAGAYKSEADYYGDRADVSYIRDNKIDVSYYKEEKRDVREGVGRTMSWHTPALTNRYNVCVHKSACAVCICVCMCVCERVCKCMCVCVCVCVYIYKVEIV